MHRVALIERETTSVVIGCFFEVYNTIGYGFLEHVYGLALERELIARGRTVSREVSIPVRYKGDHLTSQRVDLIVDARVAIEIKSGPTLPPMARRQAFNYLRATDLEVALLLHFGPEPRFYRIVHSNR